MNENESTKSEQNEKSDKILKAIRAASAVMVFGIPLVAGTAVMIGYGVYNFYKKIKR